MTHVLIENKCSRQQVSVIFAELNPVNRTCTPPNYTKNTYNKQLHTYTVILLVFHNRVVYDVKSCKAAMAQVHFFMSDISSLMHSQAI